MKLRFLLAFLLAFALPALGASGPKYFGNFIGDFFGNGAGITNITATATNLGAALTNNETRAVTFNGTVLFNTNIVVATNRTLTVENIRIGGSSFTLTDLTEQGMNFSSPGAGGFKWYGTGIQQLMGLDSTSTDLELTLGDMTIATGGLTIAADLTAKGDSNYLASLYAPTGSVTSLYADTFTTTTLGAADLIITNQWNAVKGTNIPITALWGSGGTNTAATNGTAGQALLSAANGGVYWGTAAGGGSSNIVDAGYSAVINNAIIKTNFTMTNGTFSVSGTGTNVLGYSSFTNGVDIAGSFNLSSAAITTASTATNGPANNELVAAQFVRDLFAGFGASYYATTNIDATFTNSDIVTANTTVYQFSPVVGDYGRRTYSTPTNNEYIGQVVTTNRFLQLNAGVTVNSYLESTDGFGTAGPTIKPEIYVSYDKTNWLGDWDATAQYIPEGATNLYTWVVSNPTYTSTNATGFYIQRRFKVVAQTTPAAANVLFHLGTGKSSHITLDGASTSSGDVFAAANNTLSGSNTITGPVWANANNTNTATTTLSTLVVTNATYLNGPQTNAARWSMWNSAGTHYMTNNVNGFGIDGSAATGNELEVTGDIKASGTILATSYFQGGSVYANGGEYIGWFAQDKIVSINNGNIQMMNNATTAFNRLGFGPGTTAGTMWQTTNWPALLIITPTNNPTLGIMCGTNTARYASLIASNITANGGTLWLGVGTITNNPPTDQAAIRAYDVSGTAELFAEDEAGNLTQLSSHPMTAPANFYVVTNWTKNIPKISFSANRYLGVVEWSNESLLTLLRKLELRGTNISALPAAVKAKLVDAIHTEETFDDYNTRLGYTNGHPSYLQKFVWADVQNARQLIYDTARTNELAALAVWQSLPEEQKTNSPQPEVRPARDVRKPIPGLLQYMLGQ